MARDNGNGAVAKDAVQLKQRLIAFLERNIQKHKDIRRELYGYLKQVKAVDAEDHRDARRKYAVLKGISRAAQTLVVRNLPLLERVKIVCRARNYELPTAVAEAIAAREETLNRQFAEIRQQSIRAAAKDWLARFWVEPILHRFADRYLPALDDGEEQDAFLAWLDDFTQQKLAELTERVRRWQRYLEGRPATAPQKEGVPDTENEQDEIETEPEFGDFEIPF